jgi:hypothetical protein
MKRIAAVFIVGLALALPGSALATSCNSSNSSYGGQDCQVSNNAQSKTTPTTVAASTSSLPFTGLDVVLLAAGGGTLLGVGLVVRRMSRNLQE